MIRVLISFALLFFSSLTAAIQEIVLWHSFDGPLNEKFVEIVAKFNQNPQTVKAGIKIKAIYKGTYKQTLKAGLLAVGTKEAPQILQVYEMGNLVMQAHPNAYVPLNKLTNNPSPLLQNDKFIPFFSAFYKSRQGSNKGLHSLPFSASTVILFYNKDAFRKAGLDPESPPTTWEAFEKIAPLLKKQDIKQVLASGWLSGHHIDHVAAWHNVPVATKGNGMDDDNAELVVNRSFFIHHLNKLADWYENGWFSLAIGAKAEEAFARGEIVMFTQGANRLPMLEKLVKRNFEIGVGYFPYWQSKIKTPQNTFAGSTSFWALSGHSTVQYAAIQQFFEYLASPEIQAEWLQDTCCMPVVIGAEAIVRKNKFYENGLKGRAAKIALDSFAGREPKEYSRGILLPQSPAVREVMKHEMREAIKRNKTAKQALDQIVVLGNKIMKEGGNEGDACKEDTLKKQQAKLERQVKLYLKPMSMERKSIGKQT